MDRRLIDEENGLALLFTPRFDTTPRDPAPCPSQTRFI
jgi:hypothetical protein